MLSASIPIFPESAGKASLSHLLDEKTGPGELKLVSPNPLPEVNMFLGLRLGSHSLALFLQTPASGIITFPFKEGRKYFL